VRNAAVVFGLTGTGLAVARSLHRRGVAVYGVDAKGWEIGHHSAEIRRPPFATLPHGRALADAVVEWAAGQPAAPVLFPADDPSCDFLSSYERQLRAACALPEGYRPEVASAFVDKISFYRRCLALGVALPRTLFPKSLEELEEESRGLRFPAILKPAHSHLWRARFGGRKVLEVSGRDELLRVFGALGDLQTGMTVQEVIPGPEREIFVCGGYFRPGGEALALFTARKTRQYPPMFGSASFAESEWNPGVARLSEELIAKLGFAGVCGTEYKPDPRDGEWKLIEVNPRPTLWFSLTRASGCDVVYEAYRDLAGSPGPRAVGTQRDGVRWQFFLRDLLSLWHYLRRGELRASELGAALSPLRKDETLASWRDLRATAYYPLYGFRQWRAHARGEDTGP
jgi:predicted ATP-grasp superfamily ATP-dependent carboligase